MPTCIDIGIGGIRAPGFRGIGVIVESSDPSLNSLAGKIVKGGFGLMYSKFPAQM